jgi:Concanavalin A-like lectin/glucanases superfamily/Bacterial Ig domain/Cadherin-like domain/Putative Ig domain/Calcineurin-like phosphoesterase
MRVLRRRPRTARLGSALFAFVLAATSIGSLGTVAPTPVVAAAHTALEFDGTNDYVSFGQATSTLGAATFTLEAWVNRVPGGDLMGTGTGGIGAGTIPQAYPVLTKGCGEGDGSDVDLNYWLGVTSTGAIAADFEDLASGGNHPVLGTTSFPTGEWHHIAATYDGQVWRLYLDGALDRTLDLGSAIAPRADSRQHAALGTSLQSTGLPGPTGNSCVGFFAGSIDEARVWNVARDGADIAAARDSELTSGTGLVGRWGLDDDSGPTVAGSVNNVDGTATNGPTFGVPGFNAVPPANQAPVAVADAYSTEQDTPKIVSAANGVLDNDTDGDGDPLTAVLIDDVNHGTLDLNANGGFTYTPTAGYNGPDNFNYKADDGTDVSNTVQVSLTVTAPVDPLVGQWLADEGSGSTLVDGSTAGNDGALQGNPTWVAGQHGQAIRFDGSGDYAIAPDDASLDVTDAITIAAWVRPEKTATQYLVKKATQGATNGYELSLSSAGKVFVRFNQATSTDTYRINSTTTYAINTWIHVATTYDGTTMRLYVNGVQEGSITGPAAIATNNLGLGIGAQADGTSQLQGAMDDIHLYSHALTLGEIQALAAAPGSNEAPIAVNDGYDVDQDSTFSASAALGVLGNDTDADSDPLTAVLDAGTTHGDLTLNADGSFDYTPTAGYIGGDTFTYHANDGTDDSNVATVGLTVEPAATNEAPVAVGDAFSTPQNVTLNQAEPGVLANDTDEDGDILTAAMNVGPTHGNVTLNANGSFDYVPTTGYTGPDSFTYHANDGALNSNIATVSLTVTPAAAAPPTVTLDGPTDGANGTSTSPTLSVDVDDPNGGTVSVEFWGRTAASGNFALLDSQPSVPVGTTPSKTWSGRNDGQRYEWYTKVSDGTTIVTSPTWTFNTAAGPDPVFVGAGDIADCGRTQDEATAALIGGIQGSVWTAGDNVYPNGTVTEFANCYDASWGGDIKARTRPTPGNHDWNTGNLNGYTGYFGAAATDANGKSYYSYDIAGSNWHIVNLDSECANVVGGCTAGSPQELWLRADLSANATKNVIAIWHKPRFSSAGTNLTDVQPFWSDLYEFGVDIMLQGHDHDYEVMGRTGPTGASDPTYGVRPMTVGTGGASLFGGFGTIVPTSEVRSVAAYGVLKLTLHPSSYDWEFFPIAGQTFTDSGTDTVHDAPATGNNAPVAVADAYSTPLNTAKVVGVPGVLGNDTDADSDPLTAVLVSNVSHGTLALAANGGFTYTPTTGYSGPDSFSYKANDGTADSNTVTVSLTVGTPTNTGLQLTTSSYVTFGDPAKLDLGQFTIETWFKRTGTGTSNTTGTGGITIIPLLTHGAPQAENSNVDANWILGINTTGNVIAADFEAIDDPAPTGQNYPISGTTPITDNVWHHAAATFNGTTWAVYLDGVLENSTTPGVHPRSDSIQPVALGTMIESDGTTTHGRFDGVIDEARVWDHARTGAEILASKNAELTSGTGLVARWGLNEGSGANVTDSITTPSAATGTVSGTGSSWVPGFVPPSSGTNAPDAPTLNAPTNGSTGVALSPTLDIGVSDPDADPLTVTFFGRPLASGNFGQLVQFTGVTSGTDVTTLWPNLGAGQTYEWYATVSDGTDTTTGPTWTFHTVVSVDPVFVGVGDIASCDVTEDTDTGNIIAGIDGTVWTTGDNVYDNGTAAEFTNCYATTPWGSPGVKNRTRPIPGNHDWGLGNTNSLAGYNGYYGAAATDANGKSYYSYDIAGSNWHIVNLDTECALVGGCNAGSPQETWLRADLAANASKNVIAEWHRPRYSSGTTNNQALQPLWDALYDAGADILLDGHDHIYERTVPMKSGATPADPPVADPNFGITQFTVGTGGEGHHGLVTPLPTSVVRNDETFGIMKLTLHATTFDWVFLPIDGSTFTDSGTGTVHGAPGGATTYPNIPVSASTGEKPQSKVWQHGGSWWAVMPSTTVAPSGTWVWRLEPDDTWTNVFQLSSSTSAQADVKVVGDVAHVLLHGSSPQLRSIEYISGSNTYQAWSTRPTATSISLPGSEIATIDIDSTGRMWLSTETSTDINVYYSDAPYSSFSGPVQLATGINGDDISVVTALDGKIGVLWSNQNTERFGFKTHTDGDPATTWSADELPASGSALNVGLGMADDHLNVALASDGTLYAAVKTSYDTSGYPKIALLVRRPNGTWDPVYEVDQSGTRAIVLLNEVDHTVRVVYTSSEGYNDIVVRTSPTSAINFGPRVNVMTGGLNDVTSTKENWTDEVLVMASSSTEARAAFLTAGPTGNQAPVAVADAYPTAQDTAKVVGAPGVLGNDTDGDDDPLTAILVADVSHGTLSLATNGGFSYSPTTGYTGPDSFTYKANDGTDDSNTVTVSLTVSAPGASLAGQWLADEGSGPTLVDSSGQANDGVLQGNPTWVPGQHGQAIDFDGSGDYAIVPDDPSLDISGPITIAAWVKPEKTATQYLVKKATQGATDGYELSLATTGTVFTRFNQDSSGNTYRLDSTGSYPTDGSTWVHVAATYDGTTIRLYINGVLDGSVAGPASIATNNLGLGIGAQADGTSQFQGAMDDIYLYGRALSAGEIADLATVTPDGAPDVPTLNSPADGATGVIASPTLDVHVSDPDADDLTVKFFGRPLASGNFAQLVQIAGVPSGTDATTLWPNLGQGQTFEWYATVDDGTNPSVTSPTWTFHTAPGSDPVFVGAGDIASCDVEEDTATGELIAGIDGNVFTTGDNVYDNGTSTEYGDCYTPTPWGDPLTGVKDRTRPIPGNHDWGAGVTNNLDGYFGYFGAAANAGGTSYYSYDIPSSNWHIIGLDSQCELVPGGCGVGSPQEVWLKADLAANASKNVIALWHKPRYSSGATNYQPVAPLWDALYEGGADILMDGHDHIYERFAPMKSGATLGSAPVADPTYGIQQFTIGVGGEGHHGLATTLPTSQVRNDTTFGIFKLTLHADSYDWVLLPIAGSTFTDSGTGFVHDGPNANHAPSIENPGDQSNSVGEVVGVQPVASDPDSDPLTYDDGGTLPAGLSIDPLTGAISGTPTSVEVATVTITVDDGDLTADTTFTWTINAGATAGYWLVASDGGIFTFGDAGFFGSTGGQPLDEPIVGMAPTSTGDGYWMVASDGGIFTFGDADFFGSMGGQPIAAPVVGMAPTPSGGGYWLVTSQGEIFAFGDAADLGSTVGIDLDLPIVGMAATPTGDGYWLVATDGGIFSFGDADFFGSTGGQPLDQPIVGMAPTASGNGYWLVASDGGIFTFGDADFFGSKGGQPLDQPVVGMAPTASGNGYWLVASDGGIFTFGDADFFGSKGGQPLDQPVVGMAPVLP